MHFKTTYCILLVSYVSSESTAYLDSGSNSAEKPSSDKDSKVSYDGGQVWRTILNNTKHVDEIHKLSNEDAIDVWNLKPTHVDFLVQARNKVYVDRRLRALDMNHTVMITNVQQKLDESYNPPPIWNEESLRLGHRLDFNYYPDLTVIDEYLNYVKDQYKSICTLKTIGRSVENRTIQMVIVSNGNPHNQAVVLNSGSHAREWVAVTTNLYILNDLVARFDSLPNYIQNLDWYIIPVQNPDGYLYSHSTDRFWRKNRQPSAGSNCAGVDINRNYGAHWLVKGVTEDNPCSNSYAGPTAFSEPETRVVEKVIKSKKMVAFVDLHSYGQELLYPWAAVPKKTPHEKMLHKTASEMKTTIFKATEKLYGNIGSVYHALYAASGTSIDFVYSQGVNNSFAIETRDTGLHGFLLPSDQIVDTGVEIKEAVYSMARTLQPRFRFTTPGKMNVRFAEETNDNVQVNFGIRIIPKSLSITDVCQTKPLI